MEQKALGKSTIKVAPLAFGGNVFGWSADKDTSHRLLDQFVDAGFNLIDTADVYSIWVPGHKGGESETIIGEWLAKRGGRDKVVIATKLGIPMAPDKKGLSKGYIATAVEDSLKRLKTDYIDLYQSHRDDPDTPVEETLEAYGRLVKAGKVREIGASNFEAPRLKASLEASAKHGYPRYQTIQPNYSLMERGTYEGDLEKLCRAESVSCIGYYSLASGFLSGKYRSEADLGKSAARSSRVKGYLNDKGMKVLAALDDVAKRFSASPAQVALAWLMAKPTVAAPIASATSAAQLGEIMKAATIKLDATAVEQLDKASA
ncbi:MAG: aldo/keto reductase [Alphaproteobacteria bacterium]|nr:aldo/keto reductase [Alphaproteobacteria bacterium]